MTEDDIFRSFIAKSTYELHGKSFKNSDALAATKKAATPHLLNEALSFHTGFLETGDMRK